MFVGLALQQYIKSYLTMSSLKDTQQKEVISKHCFCQNMHGFNIIKKPRVSRCFRRETKFTRHDRRCCWSYFLFYNYFLKNCRMYWRLLSACWSSGMILASIPVHGFDSRASPSFEDFVKRTFLD